MLTTRPQNYIFLDAVASFRRITRYLMDENTRPHPTEIYVSMKEAADLLAYRYKTAGRMTREQLESRINYVTAQEQHKQKVACHIRFIVVGPNGEFNMPVYPDKAIEVKPEDRFVCGAAYEARQAADDRIRSFRDTF